MLSDCKFLTFTATAMRFTSLSTDRLPKSSTNNCIVQQFACFFCYLMYFFRILGAAGLLFADGGGLREPWASCSPPLWGGGELRDSESRNTFNNYVTFCAAKR